MGVRVFPASDLLPARKESKPALGFPYGLGTRGVHEVVENTHGDRPAATAFFLSALAQAPPQSLLWVQEGREALEHGQLSLTGARAQGVKVPQACLFVRPRRLQDALWAVEEGVRSGVLSLVVGEVSAADFTTTRRLTLASEVSGTPLVLLLPHGAAGATAAQARWRVAAAPSHPHPLDNRAPGIPRWQVTLERCRAAPAAAGRSFLLDALEMTPPMETGDAPLSDDRLAQLAPHQVVSSPAAPGAGGEGSGNVTPFGRVA